MPKGNNVYYIFLNETAMVAQEGTNKQTNKKKKQCNYYEYTL